MMISSAKTLTLRQARRRTTNNTAKPFFIGISFPKKVCDISCKDRGKWKGPEQDDAASGPFGSDDLQDPLLHCEKEFVCSVNEDVIRGLAASK